MSEFDGMGSRRGFVTWLRTARGSLVTTGDGHDPARRARALELLGLDDAALDAFERASRVVVSLPCASPNTFFPQAGAAWYVHHLQRHDPDAFHLRVVLGHTDFDDPVWRPYTWWFLDGTGALTRAPQATDGERSRSVVVAGRGPLRAVPERATGADREAAEAARHGANRALSYALLGAAVERAAGLGERGRTLCVPLDLLVAYFRFAYLRTEQSPWAEAEVRWLATLFERYARGRRLGEDGRLEPVDGLAEAFVLDPASNIALFSLLGPTEFVGGPETAERWGEVEERVAATGRASGVPAVGPLLRPLPDAAPYERLLPPSAPLARALAAEGIGYSTGMAVAEHGRFADRIDPFA
ncbi:hypothetical protein ABT160_36145 [Streptomyces sp. NPDC001941]|uniref:hypothetical protein n=1 Tax=Streptomyces sp. NPDC001941 TaxID=3154659 RepID=UPI00332B8B45